MGADIWHHESAWHQDPAQALREIHERVLASEYDLAALVPKHLAVARKALAITRAEGDPYDLAELYEGEVTYLESVATRPLPGDVTSRLVILRGMYANSGEGIGNVLDIETVAPQPALFSAKPLDEAETQRLTGTPRPTAAQARSALPAIAEQLHRGDCVCFPVYDDAGQPAGWHFIGATVD